MHPQNGRALAEGIIPIQGCIVTNSSDDQFRQTAGLDVSVIEIVGRINCMA